MAKFIITAVLVVVAAIICLPNLSLRIYGWILFGIRKVLSWISTCIVWAWTQPAKYCWKYIVVTWNYIKVFDAQFKPEEPKAIETEEKLAA